MIRAQWKICESCGLPSILDRGRISHQGLRWTTRNLLQEKIDFPALPGWADVWRSALRALLLWRSLPCHFSLYLPQASQLLLMTKRRVGVSSRNWFEGASSISPFDIAEGTSFVISLPTRLSESAAPRDDKGWGGGLIGDRLLPLNSWVGMQRRGRRFHPGLMP
jgi:hypothetical protein